jgi:hypothetical protein
MTRASIETKRRAKARRFVWQMGSDKKLLQNVSGSETLQLKAAGGYEMGSLFLSRLTKEDRKKLEQQLWAQQGGKCFISEEPIDLALQDVDVDHIIPTRDNGKDDPSNFALTLAHYNRSKQAADLRVARVLARFEKIRHFAVSDDRGANLNDVLKEFGGATSDLRIKIDGDTVTYIASGKSGEKQIAVPFYQDKLSGFRYFFAMLPLEMIHHDERINPRPSVMRRCCPASNSVSSGGCRQPRNFPDDQ